MILEKVKTYQYIVTEEQLAQVVKDLDAYCKIFTAKNRKPKLALDLETYNPKGARVEDIRCVKGLDGEYEGRIRLLLLGLDPSIEDTQFIIDVKVIGEVIVASYINKFIKSCLLIGQNLKYDIPFIIEFFHVYPETIRDIMLFSQQTNAGDKLTFRKGLFDRRSHKLSAHYKEYLEFNWFFARTGMTFEQYEDFKDRYQGSNWGVDVLDLKQLEYAADDVSLTHYVYSAQLKKLEEYMKKHDKPGMLNTFKLECETELEFAIMELVGVPFDVNYYEEVVDPYLRGKLKEAEDALSIYPEFWEEITNETTTVPLMDGSKIKVSTRKVSIPYCKFINLGGKAHTSNGVTKPGQLQRALERAGLKFPNAQRETFETAIFDTSKAAKLTEKQKTIILNVITWIKAKGSLLDKYGIDALSEFLHSDGRFYPSWFQIGTDTQRTTCKKPPLQTIPGASGGDFFEDGEQIGVMIRRGIAASEDKKIIVADWSNQEVRLAYEVTKDDYLKTVFKENRDQHSEFAKEAFQLDFMPAKGSNERQAGKTAFLQHQYCGGWKATQQSIYIDTKCQLLLTDVEAKALKEKLKARYQGITDVADKCKKEVARALDGYQTLRSFENRKPIFTGYTRLKYYLDGEKKEFTRLRKWCLSKEQEILIKKTKDRDANKVWKCDKKALRVLSSYHNPAKKTAIVSYNFGKIVRRPAFKFIDVLHKNYEKWDEKQEKWSTWNNDFNREMSKIAREYFNFLVQPEGATMLKLAMVAVGKEFRKRGWDPKKDASIIAECHDSIICEARNELAEEALEILTRCMEQMSTAVIRDIPAPVTAKIGQNWGDAE